MGGHFGLGHLLLSAKCADEATGWSSKLLLMAAELSKVAHNHGLFLLFHFCCPYFEGCFCSFSPKLVKNENKGQRKPKERACAAEIIWASHFSPLIKRRKKRLNKNPCLGKANDFSKVSLVSQSLSVLERGKYLLNSFQLVLIGISLAYVP